MATRQKLRGERWLIAFAVCSSLLGAQPAINPRIARDEIRQDFLLARRALEQGHAGIYRYSSKETIHATFDSVWAGLNRDMSVLEFYRALAPIFGEIKCGHTELLMPKPLNDAIHNRTALLPIRPFIQGDELFIFREYAGLPELAGDRIIAINDLPAADVLRRLRLLVHGDGNTATSSARFLMEGFVFAESLTAVAGIESPFHLTVRSGQGVTRNVVINGIPGMDLRLQAQRIHPQDRGPRDAATASFVEGGKIAVLRIARFSDFADGDRHTPMAIWLNQVFSQINERKVAGVVLDLRDNGGGSSDVAKSLVAHFLDRLFRFFADLRMPTLDADLFPPDSRIERAAFVRGDDGFYHRTSDPNLGPQQPLLPGYTGPLIVLMNGGSFSAASEALSILQSERRATFVGEEAGGGYLGNTSGYGAAIILPHSKLKIDIPRMAYYLAVGETAHGGLGPDRGVMPDITVRESITDLLANRDVLLDKALQLAAGPQQAEKSQPPPSSVSPEDYVVSKFRDHDVVFLGEMHSVRQNLEFLQRLLPRMYATEVYNLGFEFAAYADQVDIEALIDATNYDESRALKILWHCCDLKWVTQEYADVFRTVWTLNRGLPPGAPHLRIVGLDRRSDDDSGVSPSGIRLANGITDVPDSISKLNHFDADNFFWAQVIDREILRRGEKMLVYTGEGHAYTRFIHSRGRDGGFSVGNFIYNAIGSRTMTINLHGSASDGRVELARAVEALLASRKLLLHGFGFDTHGSDVGKLPIKEYGCQIAVNPRCSGLSLEDITDGYVYLAPIQDWKPVTFRDDFITSANFAQIESRWRKEHGRDRAYTVEEVRAMARDAIRKQFLYQQGFDEQK